MIRCYAWTLFAWGRPGRPPAALRSTFHSFVFQTFPLSFEYRSCKVRSSVMVRASGLWHRCLRVGVRFSSFPTFYPDNPFYVQITWWHIIYWNNKVDAVPTTMYKLNPRPWSVFCNLRQCSGGGLVRPPGDRPLIVVDLREKKNSRCVSTGSRECTYCF